MKNLLKKISEGMSRNVVRLKANFYYHVVRHADPELHNVTFRDCYEAALFPASDIPSISERFYERHYSRNPGN